ncbi:bifunctional hydroxymethylpyrimidine kinase/phosphomethylpyrimidine kinase [Enterococcus sp. AZ072]|uniref:bifunctional hydroxymethylpyrimidine kinase/phosphomethylpyrimidine kinase n=1 Tax=unclassified Enterococcus TaxID=2608891 RepID=UPI003D2B9BF2
MTKNILTIAGSDTLGGGGLQSDLKTFEQYQLFGLTAVTCIAVVEDKEFIIQDLSSKLLEQQLQTIQSGVDLAGIKIGLINNIRSLQVIKHFLQKQNVPIVLDPVLAFKETTEVYQKNYRDLMIQELFPLATIVTPNLKEAELLSGLSITDELSMKKAAENIQQQGKTSVVIKGGQRLAGKTALDLYYDGNEFELYRKPKLMEKTINGAGCTFASAIASNLVLGKSSTEAIQQSKKFVYQAIQHGVVLKNGDGNVWYKEDNE